MFSCKVFFSIIFKLFFRSWIFWFAHFLKNVFTYFFFHFKNLRIRSNYILADRQYYHEILLTNALRKCGLFPNLLTCATRILYSLLGSLHKQPPEVFFKKGVLKNFAKFTGEHLYQGLFFNKIAGLRPATLLKKRLWYRFFSVNFVKFLRTTFL